MYYIWQSIFAKSGLCQSLLVMTNEDVEKLIVDTIRTKSCHKQDVFDNTKEWFSELKKVLSESKKRLNKAVGSHDPRIKLEYSDKGDLEAHLSIAGDTLIFHMHSNVFLFDSSNSLWQTSYLQEDGLRGYCGVINVYNFLSDSFRLNRMNDVGYLIARIFINSENHYMVQGKRQLGFLYNNFMNALLTPENLRSIVDSTILYTLDFDLYTPPYDSVKEATVFEMKELSANTKMRTGKRLGFQFRADSDEFE